MTNDEALQYIKKAVEDVLPGASESIDASTDLKGDDILDSLDLMNFLFELETAVGGKISAIDESYDDFRVGQLIKLLIAN